MPNELIEMIGSYLTDEDAVHYKMAVLHKINDYKPVMPTNRMGSLPFWFKPNQVFICAEDCYMKIINVDTRHITEKKCLSGQVYQQAIPYHIRVDCEFYYYGKHKTNKNGNIFKDYSFYFTTTEQAKSDWSWVVLSSRHTSIGKEPYKPNKHSKCIITDLNYPTSTWNEILESYWDITSHSQESDKKCKILFNIIANKGVRFCMNKYNCIDTKLSVNQLHKHLTSIKAVVKNPSRFYVRGDTADTNSFKFVYDEYYDDRNIESAEEVLHHLYKREYSSSLYMDNMYSDGTYPTFNTHTKRV
jgi:hypothetical protein